MSEAELRRRIVAAARSLFERGYSHGTSGNLSVRLERGGFLVSPTNMSLGDLTEDTLSRLDVEGAHLDGPPPSKEGWLHLAIYEARPQHCAIVHLHSSHAVAYSCLDGVDLEDALPPITPYSIMRCGKVVVIPYFRPGDAHFAPVLRQAAVAHHAMLLANHGLVTSGTDLSSAMGSAEELEETCRLFFLLGDRPHHRLTANQINELERVFGETR
ncbi:MAG TPA: 3-oxo-tetronate 4-phosphate decarboxylase [Sphingomonas sp.]|nr:3-oxo-tetronate 4-phosphate decarboxylase [Sphingomonas sp.]